MSAPDHGPGVDAMFGPDAHTGFARKPYRNIRVDYYTDWDRPDPRDTEAGDSEAIERELAKRGVA